RQRVPVDAHVATPARVRPVQEDVVGAQEAGAAGDFDADAQDGAAVDGVRVRVLGAEGGEGGAGAVEALLVVGLLEGGLGEEFLFGRGGDWGGGGGESWEGEGGGWLGLLGEELAGRGGRDEGG